MRNIIISLFFLSSLIPLGSGAEDIRLQDHAPARYIVKRGDTLWGISARFLKDPWKWPQIWGMNREEIKNPQLIYPGDVIVMENENGTTRLRIEQPQEKSLETVRLEPGIQIKDLGRAIPTIPMSAIGPFLTKTRVMSEAEWNDAPSIVAGTESSDILGEGESGYVSGLKGKAITFSIYGKGRTLVDPETGKSLGMEADYLGEARLVKAGNPAKIEVTRSVKEIDMGARLFPSIEQTVLHYVPHAPDRMISGHILSSYSGMIGQDDIVAIDLGTNKGIELGDVLAVYRKGREVNGIKLPPERVGLIMVFRAYDKVAYALVVNSKRAIFNTDTVRTP